MSNLFLLYRTTVNSRASIHASPSKVTGGIEVTRADKWPFMVRLLRANSIREFGADENGFCGGTLIAPKWVLTAGHCVLGDNEVTISAIAPEKLLIWTGSHKLKQEVGELPRGTFRSVEKVFLHPLYSEDPLPTNYDIGLLELTDEVLNAPTLSIETKEEKLPEGIPLVVLGWGGVKNMILNQAVVPLISNNRANKPSWRNKRIFDYEMVAGYPLGGISGCSGDSGGPLVYWDGAKWIQVGIVAWGSKQECGIERKPEVFTRLNFSDENVNYFDWIQEKIRVNTGQQYRGIGSFIGIKLTNEELKTYSQRIVKNKEIEKDDLLGILKNQAK